MEYQLTAGEQGAMQSLNVAAVNAKVRLYDLRQQTEQAEKDLALALGNFNGALSLLASTHGMNAATLTADFTRLVAPEGTK